MTVTLSRHAKTVKFRHKVFAGKDKYNNDAFTWQEENVYPVLDAPRESQNHESSTDLKGVIIKHDLYLPKTYTRDLLESQAYLDGQWMNVYDPSGVYDTSPNDYGRTVKVGICNG